MLKLYTVPTANGQRASIALEECGLEYETRMIDLVAGEHRTAEMLAINPIGRMPVLTGVGDDERRIYGSLAIGQYLAETTGRLRPPDSSLAAYHEWLGIIMTDLAAAFSAQFYLGVLAPQPQAWGIGFYLDVIERILGAIDAHLRDRRYFLDDDYTLVDVIMYPTAASSIPRLERGIEPYPAISAWADRVGARGAVQRGMARSAGSLFKQN